MLRLIKEMDHKIALLRLVAQGLKNAHHDCLLIRYPIPKPEHEGGFLNEYIQPPEIPKDDNEDVSYLFDDSSAWTWEYATALKRRHPTSAKKRKITPDADLKGHMRWSPGKTGYFADNGEEYVEISFPVIELGPRTFKWTGHGSRRSKSLLWSEEPSWVCILGDPEGAALFKLSNVTLAGSEELENEVIDTALLRDWVDQDQLLDLLECRGEFKHPSPPRYISYLRSLAAAADVYKLMPGATVATDVFSTSLKNALWVPLASSDQHKNPQTKPLNDQPALGSLMYGTAIDPRLLSVGSPAKTDQAPGEKAPEVAARTGLATHHLSRSQVFSCIAMFENRQVNIHPQLLEQVMAISASNSIYVAMPLICDPCVSSGPNEMKHIIGNIGKPGVSLMIPPMAPKARKVDEKNWKMINHAAFDGRMEDAFQHTSLHLSFTGYQLPIMTVEHGYQGIEANYVETLVSVFDQDEWVADLDILRALTMPLVLRLRPDDVPCRHKYPRSKPRFLLTSIDSWNEFIDRPANACIVRASGNWLGRLAAMALSAQQDFKTVVLEDGRKFCWECVGKWKGVLEEDKRDALTFIG